MSPKGVADKHLRFDIEKSLYFICTLQLYYLCSHDSYITSCKEDWQNEVSKYAHFLIYGLLEKTLSVNHNI